MPILYCSNNNSDLFAIRASNESRSLLQMQKVKQEGSWGTDIVLSEAMYRDSAAVWKSIWIITIAVMRAWNDAAIWHFISHKPWGFLRKNPHLWYYMIT